ncbi:MAG: hypothetical protein NTV89_09430 [Proteobacteria bacterium]|nr:hypothetical protein [Pseudomonadota bacterium]
MSLVKKAEEALKAAVAKVIEENKRLGIPLVIWRNGKVVHVPPEELEVREPKAKYRISGGKKVR